MKLYDKCIKCGRDGHNSAGCKAAYPTPMQPPAPPKPAPFAVDPKTVLPTRKS